MNAETNRSKHGTELPDRRLDLAREAVARYGTRCFWFLRPDLVLTEEHLPMVVQGLRNRGDREAFLLADRLCR